VRERATAHGDVGGHQRRRRREPIEHAGDEARIAIDVAAELQNRRLAVTTGERHHIGLGHDDGDDDRAPGELFVAQNGADLFGIRRERIMVQDDVGHGAELRSGAEKSNEAIRYSTRLMHCGAWCGPRPAGMLAA